MTGLVEKLNTQFSIADHLHVCEGDNGFPKIHIDNALATAEIYLHGAQITAFKPRGRSDNQVDVLWMSPLSQFQADKAIRGGVPVIWPWFGPHATDRDKPQHGFARTSEWQVNSTTALVDGRTQLKLQLTDDASSRALWPYAFELSLEVTVGTELKIELTTRNTGGETFVIGDALHSYFVLGDVTEMFIEGLDGCEYIDQLDANRLKQQRGNLCITHEVDRIYVNTDKTCVIHDAVLSRQIHVKKTGSHSTVVWNPWKDKAKAMADFSDEAYRNMLCIESANAADDVVQLAPEETHTLSQIISVVNGV